MTVPPTSTPHICVVDESGTCNDPERDWCGECGACTVWHSDVCAGCERVWGYEAKSGPSSSDD